MELVVVLLCWLVISFPVALLVGAMFLVGRGEDPERVHYEESRTDIIKL
jgi:hypothetical protein